MRKLFLSTAVVIAMGSASFAPQAAESASMSVTGSINPATCDVTLSSSSIDLGTILASSLNKKANMKQGGDVIVQVACDAAAAIAVQTTDNRTSSAMTTAEMQDEMDVNYGGVTDENVFGLGLDSANNKIGAMLLGVTNATLNGEDNTNILSSTDKTTWTAKAVSSTAGLNLVKGGYITSAADAESTSPAAVTNATYTITSGIILKQSNKYPSGEDVKLDGNVAFSVVYL